MMDAGLPDVFYSAEMTTRFPHDGCRIHVTVADGRPQGHQDPADSATRALRSFAAGGFFVSKSPRHRRQTDTPIT